MVVLWFDIRVQKGKRLPNSATASLFVNNPQRKNWNWASIQIAPIEGSQPH